MSSPNALITHRPSLQHAVTSPARREHDLTFDGTTSPGASTSDLRRRSFQRKRLRRGLTFEEVQSRGVINDNEKNEEFDDLPISSEEIKKLPKKVCSPYTMICLREGLS